MAIRTDASGDSLTRSTNLPPIATFTIMGWFQIVTDRNTFSSLMAYGATASGNYYGVQTDTDGTTLVLWNGSSAVTGSALTVGTWYHVAITVAGTGAGQATIYLNGAQDINSNGNGSNTATQIYIGNDRDSEWLNGRFFGLKIWDVALTAAEVAQEMWSITPQRLANLNAWYPCFAGATERLADYSGNGRNWTGNGTLTDEDGPGLPWQGWEANTTTVAGGASIALSMAVASLSTTPDTVAAAVARDLSMAVASGATTPDTVTAAVARALSMAVASGSTTPDTVTAAVARALSLAAASGSTTPDTVAAAVARGLTLAVASLSTTPDTVAAAVARALTLAVASQSTTGNIALAVPGIVDLTLAVASQSTTPDTVVAAVARALSANVASQSTTPDTVAAAVARALSVAIASGSTTPDAALSVVRELSLSVASLSSTGAIDLDVGGLLSALLDHTFRLLARRWSFVVLGSGTISVPAARRSFEAHLMAVAEVPKDPVEELDYQFDYSTLLESDTIATSVWAVDSGDVAIDSDESTTTTTTVRVTGGTLGTKSKVKNTVTTTAGQVLVRRLVLVLQEM